MDASPGPKTLEEVIVATFVRIPILLTNSNSPRRKAQHFSTRERSCSRIVYSETGSAERYIARNKAAARASGKPLSQREPPETLGRRLQRRASWSRVTQLQRPKVETLAGSAADVRYLREPHLWRAESGWREIPRRNESTRRRRMDTGGPMSWRPCC